MSYYAGTETHKPITNRIGSVQYGQTAFGEFFCYHKDHGSKYYPTMEAAENAAQLLNDKICFYEQFERKQFDERCSMD